MHLRYPALLILAACAASCGPTPIVVAPMPDDPSPPPAPPQASAAPAPTNRVAQVAGDPAQPRPVATVASACSLDARVASMGPRCERLRAVSAVGSGPGHRTPQYGPPAAAFDGDSCTAWSSGAHPPQSATVDLGAPVAISAILLVPEMSPASAAVVHAIEVSDEGKTFRRVGEVRAPMRSGEPIELPIPGAVVARFVRVATLASPSWVAWRDIVPVRCAR